MITETFMLDYIPSRESLGFIDEVDRENGLYKFMGKVRIGLGKYSIPIYHCQIKERSIGIYYIEDVLDKFEDNNKNEIDFSKENPLQKETFKVIENGFEDIFKLKDEIKSELLNFLTPDKIVEVKDGKLKGEILKEKDYVFTNDIGFGILGITKTEEVKSISACWGGMEMVFGDRKISMTKMLHTSADDFSPDLTNYVISLSGGYKDSETPYLVERGTIDKYIQFFNQVKENMNKILINI